MLKLMTRNINILMNCIYIFISHLSLVTELLNWTKILWKACVYGKNLILTVVLFSCLAYYCFLKNEFSIILISYEDKKGVHLCWTGISRSGCFSDSIGCSEDSSSYPIASSSLHMSAFILSFYILVCLLWLSLLGIPHK